LSGSGLPRDAAWFERLYKRCQRDVHKTLTRYAGAGKTAEDLTEETFLKALEHRDQTPDDEDEVLFWLLRVARNTALDNIERASRRPLDLTAEYVDSGQLPTSQQATDRDPHARIDDRVDMHWALRRLKPTDRELLLRRYSDDIPIEQLAAELHVSRNTLEKRLQRARDRLELLMTKNNSPAALWQHARGAEDPK